MKSHHGEIIVVRSLTESDLGLFAAHRAAARSKQRAININAAVARLLLGDKIFNASGGHFDCQCIFGTTVVGSSRWFGKVHKNWRLGGKKIEGEVFAKLDSKDFVLIRSVTGNDGQSPLILKFICKKSDRVIHAGIAAIVERDLKDSMAAYRTGDSGFDALAGYCGSATRSDQGTEITKLPKAAPKAPPNKPLARMPRDGTGTTGYSKARTIRQKLRTPHILEKMLQVSGDLSAPAQLRFMETVRELAEQLRRVLLETNGIVPVARNHRSLWSRVKDQHIGFVDGGLANLSMLGSAPIAARVGGYIVVPGRRDSSRESFRVLKHLIDELYASSEGGVYDEAFPDIGALRDAARISIEAAGAVQMLAELPELKWVMVHGALVNPVSRYTDIMQDRRVRHRFPDFSSTALRTLLPSSEPERRGRDRNFISVHLRQLELMQRSSAIVCGVIEREATTSSVCKALLNGLDDNVIAPLLPIPPAEWKRWFRNALDPADDEDFEGQRISDSLLFRCVLEPGEALRPVIVDRNELRRAPQAWHEVIARYPRPAVSYLQQTEWGAPIRVELFEKDLAQFAPTIELIYHCALLLPNYAFPVGLDIVDKFARIPDWMSRPVNTRTAVLALKQALDSGDARLFDSIRYILCGSSREWLFRPGYDR